jgi:hypothetical protein
MDHMESLLDPQAPPASRAHASTQRGAPPGGSGVIAPSEELQRLSGLVLALLTQAPGVLPPGTAQDVLVFLGNVIKAMNEQR